MAENAFNLYTRETWNRIRKEIVALDDPEERRIREELYDKIIDAITDYNVHVREYEYGCVLKKWHEGGILFEPCDTIPLREKWDSTFRIPSDEPSPFRWEELCLRDDVLHDRGENTPASDAFDRAEKSTLAMFFDDCDEAYMIKGCEKLTAADVEEMRALSDLRKMDIYLMPAEDDPKWSYVTSHEQDCDFGPFFVVRDK
jgi:hypothetical protein